MKSRSCVTRTLASQFLLDLGTSESCHLAHLFLNGIDAEIIKHLKAFERFDSRTSPEDYVARQLLSKYPYFDVEVDRCSAALEKFLGCEERCREVNHQLPVRLRKDPELAKVFYLAQRKIARILGDFSWDSASVHFAFGPGASFGLSRKRSHPSNKLDWLKPTVTAGCFDLATAFLRYVPGWEWHLRTRGGSLSVVAGNRIVTVPKNALTDRVIAIEPLMNMIIQKGIGSLIRFHLHKSGCNLNDQTVNRTRAMKSSSSGKLATLDLSAASDSIALQLVSELLPADWYEAILLSRSQNGVLPNGSIVNYHKVSSMGNGFTFELESLIFLALARSVTDIYGAVGSAPPSVYGDDLIVDVDVAEPLIQSLKQLGFETNSAKSYWEGGFRESCGLHAFQGADCTPIYLRENLDSLEKRIWWTNSLKRYAHRSLSLGYGCDSRFFKAYSLSYNTLPDSVLRLSIPEGVGDGAIVRDFDDADATPSRCKNYIEGWIVRQFRRFYRQRLPKTMGVILHALWDVGPEVEDDGGIYSRTVKQQLCEFEAATFSRIPTSKYVYKMGKPFIVPQWRNLGPWI